ncbi:IS110 family transposase [Candidatus Nitrospira neomarina]|uniref:IS110 family transposase n=1 Tax=Candidatus Nitrospira neomarina TaxID=3020899 RepID=A0AA96K0L0_9BACT|nr:IS110 family transposase [Candidatus Nitrospira neomarina]WNM62161.1 IS110 family transposase [Candidatus Nitrospira neomarina]WNM62257.1 IS110 family transposase [Candidatus Nitrospira neomarina]
MIQPALNVGVDVAKDAVVVACAESRFPVQSISNQRALLRAWLKSLPAGSRIGLESTGDYHELLADLAQALGHTVFLLNPLETRHYAKAMGNRAKTDRVDAELIARLIAQEHRRLRPYTPPTPNQRKLDRLIRRRATIVRLKGTLKLSMRNLGGFAAELKAVVSKLEALIAKIDATLSALAAGSPQHQEAQQRVQTIVGVGPLVGISLTNTLQRVPFRKADAFVAFTGLDPRANDSGRKAGRRRLSKRGPAELRRLLFNAAMAAIKTKVWKPIYESYRTQGWSTTASLVIIARKIARAAWSIHHYRTTFHPERITQGLT